GVRTHQRNWPEVGWDESKYRVLTSGDCGATRLLNPDTIVAPGGEIKEIYLDPSRHGELSFITEAVLSILGDHVVPYSLPRRREKFRAAFRSLSPYIERWQAL